MQIQNYTNLSVEEISALEEALTSCENLLQVLQWNNKVIDSIQQDEFTHDIVIRWGDCFLVFGAT